MLIKVDNSWKHTVELRECVNGSYAVLIWNDDTNVNTVTYHFESRIDAMNAFKQLVIN